MFCNKHVSSPLPENRLSDNRMKINVAGQINNEMCYENMAFKIFKGNMFPLNVMLHKRIMFFYHNALQ